MPNRSFFWFFLPAGLAMILFIGLPIISTGIQSFYAQHDQILVKVKKCDPFGCKESVVVDQEATSKIRDEKPLGKFNGFGTYVDRNIWLWSKFQNSGMKVNQLVNLLIRLETYHFTKH